MDLFSGSLEKDCRTLLLKNDYKYQLDLDWKGHLEPEVCPFSKQPMAITRIISEPSASALLRISECRKIQQVYMAYFKMDSRKTPLKARLYTSK